MFFNGATQTAFDSFVRSPGTGAADIRRWRRFVITLFQSGANPDMWYVRFLLEEHLGPDRADFYMELLERNLESMRASSVRIAR